MLTRFISLITILFLLNGLSINAQYQVNDNCLMAWEQIMDLKFNTAKETIHQELQQNPTNYYAYYLDQACDALELVIDPSEKIYTEFEDNFEKRMELMVDHDVESPYYLGCRSEMLLQMCIFNVLYGDKLSGIRKGYRAYKATYQNREEVPDFEMSKKLDGFFNIGVSNLPSFVRWAASVFGVSGNAEDGMNLLKGYYEHVKDTPGLNLDAAVYVILPYKLNKEPAKAYEFIQTIDTSVLRYKLINYFHINTAYRSGRNKLAYELLQDFDLAEIETQFLPYDYMMGKVLLRKLDKEALTHFQRYLRHTKNENYIKEIFYSIAQHYLVHGDIEQFKYYKLQAYENGKAVNERDRETLYDSELDYIPDPNLLRAKLLIDGGYFDRSEKYLEAFMKQGNDFSPYNLEYKLLRGRLLLSEGNTYGALTAFKKVLTEGEDAYYYFACEAAIKLGWIYLDTNKETAEEYFEKALDLYQSEFYEYLEEIAMREIKLLERN